MKNITEHGNVHSMAQQGNTVGMMKEKSNLFERYFQFKILVYLGLPFLLSKNNLDGGLDTGAKKLGPHNLNSHLPQRYGQAG